MTEILCVHTPGAVVLCARTRRYFAVILLAALVARLAAIQLFGLDQPPILHEYGIIARSLTQNGVFAFDFYGYEPLRDSSFMPPLYPLIMAGVMTLTGDQFFLTLRLLQALVSTIGCLFSFGIAWELWRRRDVALLAALGTALYPPFSGQVTQADTAVLDVVLLQAFVWAMLRGVRLGRSRALLVAGCILGLAGLVRPPALVAIVAVPFALWALRHTRRRIARLSGAALAGVLIVVLPWTVRNTLLHGTPVLVSTNGGFNFWIGNHAGATGEFVFPDLSLIDSVRGMPETERDAFFYQRAFDFIGQHPDEYLSLLMRKLTYFLWFRPNLGATYQSLGLGEAVGPARVLYLLSYTMLMPLAVAGLVTTRRDARRLLPAYVTLLSYLLVAIIYFVATRFRAPVEALLVVFAAYAVAQAGRAWRNRRVAPAV